MGTSGKDGRRRRLADVKVEDDMPTAQNAPSEAAGCREGDPRRSQPPLPADDGDSDEEGAAAPQAPQRSSCRHSVAVPPDWCSATGAARCQVLYGRRARKRTYPFVLDAFQETSVSVLERNEFASSRAHLRGKERLSSRSTPSPWRSGTIRRCVHLAAQGAGATRSSGSSGREFGDVGLMTARA